MSLSTTRTENSLLTRTFALTGAALLVSAATAFMVATTPTLMNALVDPVTRSQTWVGWCLLFAPLVMVLCTAGRKNWDGAGAVAFLMAFAAVNGTTLSYVSLEYGGFAIAQAFVCSTGLFVLMSFAGALGWVDLTRAGGVLLVGLVALLLVMIVNLFMGSAALDFLITGGGIVLFTLLTAYDVQQMKLNGGSAVLGALDLYLDFVNLFLFVLRLFGAGKDD